MNKPVFIKPPNPMDEILKYFPELSSQQISNFEKLNALYHEWNQKINVISRKDIEFLYTRHILHSLAVSKIIHFTSGTRIMDVGTGGGFPGIPLAILYPEVEFLLVDSIGKKIKVVEAIALQLSMNNVSALNERVENIKDKFDFIVSRAVTEFPKFVKLVKKNISSFQRNAMPNGIFYLKGGEFNEEIKVFNNDVEVFEISSYFSELYFDTKKIIFLPVFEKNK